MIAAVAMLAFLGIQGPVEWSGPPDGCARPPTLDQVVEAELQELTAAERQDVAVAVRVGPTTEGGVTVQVRVAYEGRTMTRVLTVADCGLVVEALGLIVGLAVSPLGESSQNAATPSDAGSAGGLAGVPEPRDAVASVSDVGPELGSDAGSLVAHDAATESSRREPTRSSMVRSGGVALRSASSRRRVAPPRMVIGLSGGVRVGLLGSVGGALGLAVGPRWSRFRMDLGMQYGPASVLRSRNLEGGGVEVATWVGQLVAGPMFPVTRQFALSVEGVVEVGAVRVASFGVDNPRRVSRPWVTLGAGATVHWNVLRWLSLTLSADGAWAAMRHIFVLGEDARPLARTTSWGGRFRVGTEFHFF